MDIEQSLVAWVIVTQLNANDLSRKARQLSDLADGMLIYELMGRMCESDSAPRYFSTPLSDAKDSVSSRHTNLRKLITSFELYMTQVLSLPITDSIDLGVIARNKDSGELLKLLELVIYAVIKCEEKETYIGRILQLSQACQGELMVFIETVLDKFEKKRMSLGEGGGEVERLQLANAKLSRDLETAIQELAEERSKQEDYRRQLADLSSDLDKKTVKRPDNLRFDLESQLAEKTTAVLALQKQLDDLSKGHEYELASLRDELDVANERAMQVPKLELALESYKKKAEDGNALKKQVKEMHVFNESLQSKLHQFEDERAAVTQTQHSLSVYKEQLTQEKEKSASLSLQLQGKDKELKELLREKIQWEERRQVYETKLQRLNEDMEKLKAPDSLSDDSFSSFHKTYNTEYEEQIKNLESENRRLQVMIGNEELVRHFNEQIDAALLGKKQAEDRLKQTLTDLHAAKTQIEDLTMKVQTLENGLKLTQSQLTDTEAAVSRLESELSKLQGTTQENDRLKAEKDGYMSDLKQIYREKDDLQRKCLEAKDEVHHLREDLTTAQAKMRELEIDRDRAELKLKEVQEAGPEVLRTAKTLELSSDTIKQLETERENLKMSVENSNLKLALREKDDELKELQIHRKSLEETLQKSLQDQRELMAAQHREELEKVQSQLVNKDLELQALMESTDELKSMWFKEEKLMVAVVHEMGMEMMKERTRKDTSYLAQQRDKAAKS